MSGKAKLPLAAALVALLAGAVLLIAYGRQDAALTLAALNERLEADGVYLGMPENELVYHWGLGEYVHGFGGHGRNYEQMQSRIGIPDDSDNDLYGKVGTLEFSNPSFSVFGIKAGGDRAEAVSLLQSFGFKPLDDSGDLFANGEFGIALRGEGDIASIQIWFMDKDLKDRQY